MKTPLYAIPFLFLLFWLSGCATLGYDDIQIDDTKDAILVANAEIRGANFLLQDLIRREAISKADAQTAKDHLDDAHDVLNEALAAVDLHGDLFTAEDKLDAAIWALDVALRLLAPHAAPDLEEAA